MSNQKKKSELKTLSVEEYWEESAKRLRMCETSPVSWDTGKCPEYLKDYSLFSRDQSTLAHAYLVEHPAASPKPL